MLLNAIKANPRGWLIVIIGFFALSLSFSARSALGLSMTEWEKDLGWARSFISYAGALSLVMMAIASPISGNLVDRYGPRFGLSAGLIFIGAGMSVVSLMQSQAAFLIGFSLVAGLGFGIVANHIVATAITHSFKRNQGLAVGIGTAGSTAGQLLVVPFLAFIMQSFHWRWSFAGLALISLLLIPVIYFALKEKKQTSAVAPNNDAPQTDMPALSQRLNTLCFSPTFHLLFWSFVICGFTTAGVIETHLLPYAAACGFPPLSSATAYGVLSAVNLVGMVLAGWLTDRVNRPILLASIYILRGFSFIILLFIIHDIRLLFIFAVLFGLFDYSTLPVIASLVATHLGLKLMGLAMGVLAAGHAIGAAIGAFAGGYLFDLFAHYDWIWIASILLALFAGILVLFINENRRNSASPVDAVPA